MILAIEGKKCFDKDRKLETKKTIQHTESISKGSLDIIANGKGL